MTSDGKIVAAVPTNVLENILRWKQAGATFEDVLHRLRLKCVPPNIVPKHWMPGQFAASSWHTHMYIFSVHFINDRHRERK